MTDQVVEKSENVAAPDQHQDAPAKAEDTTVAKESAPQPTEEESKPAEATSETTAKHSAQPAETESKVVEAATEAQSQGDAEKPDANAAPAPAQDSPAPKDVSRRKSGTGGNLGRTLSKKGSKARMLHIEAKPGDHFLVKLKGFPAWPAVVCDEEMLPEALLTTRPVTAAKPDGTYNPNYAEGGKRVYDRTFPVMYLHTNEFGWVVNTALTELSPEKARESITEKTRKDLKLALELAVQHHSIDHYKGVLKQFMADAAKAEAEAEAQELARREAAATPKKSKKAKDADGDVAMDEEGAPKSSKSKKRKAGDGTNTPQRSDSVKKPKIKLNTSKSANGTPKADSAKKAATSANKSIPTLDEGKLAKMTPEERHYHKAQHVKYLRHKLQKALLPKEAEPRAAEMKEMSDIIQQLEKNHPEAAIIRETKIHKVFRAIVKKREPLPREDEFNFKERSQALANAWGKMLADDAPANPSAASNGAANADDKASEEPKADTNGASKPSPTQEKSDSPPEKAAVETAAAPEAKEQESSDKVIPTTEPVAAEG